MKISEIEINKVSSLDSFDRYKYAIKRIADHTYIYTLKNKQNYWAISKVENDKLFPMWPALEYAKNCVTDDWRDFDVVKIDLNEFQADLMPSIKKEGFLINVFPVGRQTGFVVDIEEFIRDLSIELEKYE